MERRDLLTSILGVSLLHPLSGCLDISGNSSPNEETQHITDSQGELERTDDLQSDEDFIAYFRERIESADIDVETLFLAPETALDGGIFVLEYGNWADVEDIDWRDTRGPVEQEPAEGVFDEMAEVAIAYAVVIGNGWEQPEMLGVNTFFRRANFSYSWYIESEWAKAYFDGDLTGEDYWETVLDTASVIGPPPPGG